AAAGACIKKVRFAPVVDGYRGIPGSGRIVEIRERAGIVDNGCVRGRRRVIEVYETSICYRRGTGGASAVEGQMAASGIDDGRVRGRAGVVEIEYATVIVGYIRTCSGARVVEIELAAIINCQRGIAGIACGIESQKADGIGNDRCVTRRAGIIEVDKPGIQYRRGTTIYDDTGTVKLQMMAGISEGVIRRACIERPTVRGCIGRER